ncbi:hypothetical protein F52700_7809 [Fusarium sp. NRRL 52700]|nr:hypothetical protein F52700_7809 [Fusarium sp. NRRL 52700]
MEHEPSAAMAMPRIPTCPFIMALHAFTGVQPPSLTEVLSRMIYGSNMISCAGGSLTTTYKICHAVFEERSQVPEEITENDDEYQEITKHLEFRNIPVSPERILQSYRETRQHALAAMYLIRKIVLDGHPYDDATFKEAHHILTYKIDIDIEPRNPGTVYSGEYRQSLDMRFLEPVEIPTAMFRMIADLIVYQSQPIHGDAYRRICSATEFCHRFNMIRPFQDGNGRMHRLFLTTLLLRAGICPAVYGLYAFDRFQYSQVESGCYRPGNQGLIREENVIAFETNLRLAKFVLDHIHGGWDSPADHMNTFLQVTCPRLHDPSSSRMEPE